MERFDLRSCRWEALAAMEDALTDPPAAAYGRYIYVMGGLLGTRRQSPHSRQSVNKVHENTFGKAGKRNCCS